MLPEDLDATISKRLKKQKPEEDGADSGQRSSLDLPASSGLARLSVRY
jgi:hypothetical protein